MSPTLHFILARSSDDDWIKVVGGVIVAIIWGIGALVSAVNKKAQEAKRRQQYGRVPRDVSVSPAQQQQQQRAKAQKQRSKRRPVIAAAPPVPVRAVSSAPPAAPEPAAIAQSTRNATAAAAAPPAKRIARLVRRPESLRAALILNEILAPPPGLKLGTLTGPDVY
jgi:hypothetical protein